MGLGLGSITLLLQEDRRRPFGGAVVTLGRQTIDARPARLARLLAAYGKGWPADAGVDDEALLRVLGFAEIVSVDVDDFERPTRLLDLNDPVTPSDLVGRFDLVLDGGTLEHVFHVPNAFAHMLRMVKPGGRIIHLSPSSNWLDHGFYMFSPTLFIDYYRENGISVDVVKMIRQDAGNASWDVFDYDPLGWSRIGSGGLDGRAYLIFAVATADGPVMIPRNPRQGYYVDAWHEGRVLLPAAQSSGPARRLLAGVPGGIGLARGLRRLVRLARTGTVFGQRRSARIANR